MCQYEKIPRIPLEGATEVEGCGTLDFGDFSCTNVRILNEDGASGIVYEATSDDYYCSGEMPSARLIVKECYPVEIAEKLVRAEGFLSLSSDADEDDAICFERFLKQYKNAFANHATLYQSTAREQIVVPNRSYSLNGTEYLVSEASNGDTMTLAFQNMDLADQIRTLIRVSEAIAAIHEAGYVYLDLKPDNILCIRNSDTSSSRLYTGEIKLFDFDTATRISDLSKADTLISGSGGWSAHEQTHQGYRDKIGSQSDFYSIGSLLFWIAVGRPPKSNEVIHADGRWSISSRDCSNGELEAAGERAFQCVRRILDSTLTVDPALRYPTTKPLIDDLTVLGDLVLPVGPTHAADHMAVMAKLDALIALAYQQVPSGAKPPSKEPASGPTSTGYEQRLLAGGLEDDLYQTSLLDEEQLESGFGRENPAVAGYAVYRMLTMLASNFAWKDLQDDVRAALSSTAAEVKEVLVSRNAAESENLFETAVEMVNSAMPLLVCNMALGRASDLSIPAKAANVCERTAATLSGSIIEKDVEEMFWHRTEMELCVKAIAPLATAGAVKKHSGEYLSSSYLAEIDGAIDSVVSAIEDADAEKLDACIKEMESVLNRVQDDAIAGMISREIGDWA